MKHPNSLSIGGVGGRTGLRLHASARGGVGIGRPTGVGARSRSRRLPALPSCKVRELCASALRNWAENARSLRFVRPGSALRPRAAAFGILDLGFLCACCSMLGLGACFRPPRAYKTKGPCIFRRFFRRECAKRGNLAVSNAASVLRGRVVGILPTASCGLGASTEGLPSVLRRPHKLVASC